jgi:protein-tyrosine-phosphatase
MDVFLVLHFSALSGIFLSIEIDANYFDEFEKGMEHTLVQPPGVLKLAGHAVRWNLLTSLARSDYRVQDLVEQLHLPQNLVSYHLRQLREGHLVTERRSAADERAVFYRLDLERFQALYFAAGETLHPAVISDVTAPLAQGLRGNQATLRVLFLCTENSARSQMAEALFRHLSHGTVEALSAGSQPAAELHPLARRCMERLGIDMSGAVPKHFEVFRGQHFDAIITVCDRVLETCPTFPDDPQRIHWSFLDPATVQGSEAEQLRAFEQISLQLTMRIRFLLTLLERKHSTSES